MKKFLFGVLVILSRLVSNYVFTNLIFLYNCIRFKRVFYLQKISNPITFNEKINYIKFRKRNSLAPLVADKFKVRGFIEEEIGAKYLVPLIGCFERFEDIDFARLPNQFVLKLNNGSGFNFICQDVSQVNISQIRSRFNKALAIDIYQISREWHYRMIESKLIIEEFLGQNILDYKVHCNSEIGPFCIQLDINRFSNHKRDFYDLNWQKMDISFVYPKSQIFVKQPENLQEMLSIAKKLSRHFLYSRIDFYEVYGKLYFGEITMHPEGGLGPFGSYEMDRLMGEFIKL